MTHKFKFRYTIPFLVLVTHSVLADDQLKSKSPTCDHIKQGVYVDKIGDIYFRVDNTEKIHPNDEKNYKNIIFRKQISYNKVYKNLRDFVDLKTIKRLDYQGTYYQDKNFVYIVPGMQNYEPYFLAIKNKNIKFIGSQNLYLKTDEAIYHHGTKILDINLKTAKFITTYDRDTKYEYNILTDNDHIFLFGSTITFKSLCMMNINNQLKTTLLKRYFDKTLNICKQYPAIKIDRFPQFDLTSDDYPATGYCQRDEVKMKLD